MQVWLDGRLLPAAEARLPWDDRGLLLGEGLFETLLVRRGRPIEVQAHLARLSRSARSLGLALPWEPPEILAAIQELLEANRAPLGLDDGEGALRITLTGGSGPRGLLPPAAPRPRLLISIANYTRPDSGRAATAIIAPWPVATRSPLRGHKSLSAFESVLAARHAREQGLDEALLLNEAGHLVEAAAANLFLVDAAGRLCTPPLADGALPGITRAHILHLAEGLGLTVETATPLTLDDLAGAVEVFLSNSLTGLRPLRLVQGEAGEAGPPLWRAPEAGEGVGVGAAGLGPVSRRLRQALEAHWEADGAGLYWQP